MEFGEINLFENENLKKIKLITYSWEQLLGDKSILYSAICDLLLSDENLFYYASQKESTKTLLEPRKYIRELIEKNIIDMRIDDIFSDIGWNKDEINIENTHFQGDLAEYLMCILLDRFTKVDTLISKVSLKTSPSMPSYGNDNIFYDYEQKLLNSFSTIEELNIKSAELIMVFLPILSKIEFLEYFKGRLKKS